MAREPSDASGTSFSDDKEIISVPTEVFGLEMDFGDGTIEKYRRRGAHK